MTNKQFINLCGKMFCKAIVITEPNQCQGYAGYLRWLGYYSLRGSICDKFKLYRRNA